jgi:hypothetical protein
MILYYSILDIWDVHKPQLALLGIDPTIGNVKPNNTEVTEDNENKLTCCVKSQLFPSSESYRLTISPTKVINLILKIHLQS